MRNISHLCKLFSPVLQETLSESNASDDLSSTSISTPALLDDSASTPSPCPSPQSKSPASHHAAPPVPGAMTLSCGSTSNKHACARVLLPQLFFLRKLDAQNCMGAQKSAHCPVPSRGWKWLFLERKPCTRAGSEGHPTVIARREATRYTLEDCFTKWCWCSTVAPGLQFLCIL